MDHNFTGLSVNTIKGYARQMLNSLKVLKEHSIIHCDLKPENVLLQDGEGRSIKLIDFGSSCFANEKVYTYIQSRFYRAPEIMLGIPYTTAIDIWSLGCILAELYMGFPLFPGESETEQMALIVEVNGLPPAELLREATRSEVFFDPRGQLLPLSGGKAPAKVPAAKTLRDFLKCDDALFIDFLAQCFIWDPAQRITPEQALKHPWLLSEVADKEATETKGGRKEKLNGAAKTGEQSVLARFKETLKLLSTKHNPVCETERVKTHNGISQSISTKQKKISLVSNKSKYRS